MNTYSSAVQNYRLSYPHNPFLSVKINLSRRHIHKYIGASRARKTPCRSENIAAPEICVHGADIAERLTLPHLVPVRTSAILLSNLNHQIHRLRRGDYMLWWPDCFICPIGADTVVQPLDVQFA